MKKIITPDYNIVSDKINPYIHNTPILSSSLINDLAGVNVFFKCEHLQKMGAFKMRGAVNAILNLTEEQKLNGVVTHSSGNFAQALALAANLVGIKAYIVMPSSAPKVKIEAVKAYNGNIILCEPTLLDRELTSSKISKETGATFIHPSNNEDVIIGQGTAAKELLDYCPNITSIYTPVGGGGLIAGTILARNAKKSKCLVIGGEPKNVDDAYRSLISGKIELFSLDVLILCFLLL